MAKMIQYTLIALLIFTPLAFGAVEVWAKSVLGMTAFGLLGVWLIQYARGKEFGRLRIPRPLWGMAGVFMALVLYQWAGSGSLYPYGTFGALVLGSAYITVFGLVVSAFRTDHAIHQMVLALMLIGFGIALFSIFQKYGGNGKSRCGSRWTTPPNPRMSSLFRRAFFKQVQSAKLKIKRRTASLYSLTFSLFTFHF